LQNVNFDVATRYGTERATKWLYSGEHPTICINTESGNSVTGTGKHRLLVLRDSVLDWVHLRDIKLTDYLCVNPHSVRRSFEYAVRSYDLTVDVGLAYVLGCLLKKSYCRKGEYHILLPLDCSTKFLPYFNAVFAAPEVVDCNGRVQIVIKEPRTLEILNSLLGNKTALPWCIAKTSSSAQVSFVAALVDLSSINKITFDHSVLGKELLCLLNCMGVMANLRYSNITLPDGEEHILNSIISQYSCRTYSTKKSPRSWYGVPADNGSIVPYSSMNIDDLNHNAPLYRFVKVTSIKDAGVQKVYDLSVNENNPSYVANGLVSHNTMDTSLTVFIEQMRAYRDRITRKLLYNKIFPLISMVNGFTVKGGKIIQSTKTMDVEDALDVLQDGSKLLIPVVHWNKQLKPEGDTAYLDLLDRMTAAGVPVPLRAMAAAGGFNLDEVLSQEEDDLSMRKKMMDYVKRLNKYKVASPEEGGMESTSSSLYRLLDESPNKATYSSVLAKTGRKSILKRKFGDPELFDVSKTGKKKYIRDQVGRNHKINNSIIKAVKSIAKNKKTALTHKTTTLKFAGGKDDD
jgi:hypothetical protein